MGTGLFRAEPPNNHKLTERKKVVITPYKTRAIRIPAATILGAALLLAGCASQQTAPEQPPAESADSDAANRTPLPATGGTEYETIDSSIMGKVVYFDFDRDDIKPEYRALIAANAKYLKAHPQATLKLGGHADERGSREYNLALSERRAKAVMNQLVLEGIGEGRLSTAAYGEEYPAVKGHDEAAWSKNRRVEFNYTQTGGGADGH